MKNMIIDALVILFCLVIGFGIITIAGCESSLATENLPAHVTEQIDNEKLWYVKSIDMIYYDYHKTHSPKELHKLYDHEYERFVAQRDKIIEHHKARIRVHNR